ncbi:integrase [Vibrio albus]|uniref:Integrase n=1 Tax=Vibrio albus TaxID=2200953 RepID=A0A2U3B8D8_9VIBR|nr:tyrosine-type recombinase/integrase [Vibrio albus]PWI33066.1 integrase [Vibrio albus]
MPRVHSARDKEEFTVILDSLEQRRGIKARRLAELLSLWALRVSDLLAITWHQVEKAFNTGEFAIIETKTGKRKVITLTPVAVKLLNSMREIRPNDTYLFESEYGSRGRPISRVTAWRWISETEQDVIRYRREHGLLGGVNLGTHSMRKTGSRLRQQKGVKLAELQQLLNHSSPATTVNYLDNREQDLINTYAVGDDALF